MICSIGLFADGQSVLIQWKSAVVLSLGGVEIRSVVQRACEVGMVFAKEPLLLGDGLVAQLFGSALGSARFSSRALENTDRAAV